ncbi:MAG: hypothetical protein A2138_10280 [Deltaproteobacteria bacterium RBG_16_71_12]|nr:MAG: hypothetical protein A2138_10280 [Deltaproteobacteria bacterium RBG_16_71_12]
MPLLPLLLTLTGAVELPASAVSALDRGEFRATPAGFRVIALSHLADGCAAQVADDPAGARSCVERAYARALETRPKGARLDDGKHGLWLTHLALILGDSDATGPCLDEDAHHQVAKGLAQASLADPTAHAPSYPGRRERWPADQAATLAAIARFEAAHGGRLLQEPLARYSTTLARTSSVDDGLPMSEVHGYGTGKLPRGCALSYSVRYFAEIDPAIARDWWERYRERYLVDRALLIGFREWPPGVERKADADSGPIIGGVGAAATAFGIAAARAMGDTVLAARLEATADLVALASSADRATARAATSTLAEAIRFQAAHQAAFRPAR